MKYKLIIISSTEEISPFLKLQKFNKIGLNFANSTQTFSTINLLQYKNWLLLQSGIGLTNAAINTSIVLSRYLEQISEVILVGSGGYIAHSQKPEWHVLDTVLIDQGTFLNADLSHFNYPLGITPNTNVEDLKTNHHLNLWIAKKLNIKQQSCNIASSNQFVKFKDDLHYSVLDYNIPIHVIDMEASAIIQTTNQFQLPVSVIKIISDKISHKQSGSQNQNDFKDHIQKVAEKIANTLLRLLGEE